MRVQRDSIHRLETYSFHGRDRRHVLPGRTCDIHAKGRRYQSVVTLECSEMMLTTLRSRALGFDSRSGRCQVVITWMGDCVQTGKVYNQHQGQLSLLFFRGRYKIEYRPVWLGLKRGAFKCVRWQITLCDSVWQVTLRSWRWVLYKKLYTTFKCFK